MDGPTTKRRRHRRAVLALGLGLAVLSPSVFAQNAVRDVALADTIGLSVERAAALEEELRRRVEASRREMDRLSATIRLSDEKREALEAAVRRIADDEAGLRNDAVRVAAEREALEGELASAADRLATLGLRERELLDGLAARRDVLAEVLAALQRMGRNPPPALLVTPDDALSSVRSAILMGAVVPALRDEAERLVADLADLKRVRTGLELEREGVAERLAEIAESEQRLALLTRTKREVLERAGRDLAAERERIAELAESSGTLEELTNSLDAELEIASLRRNEAEEEAERQRREAAAAAARALRKAREAAAAAEAPAAPEPDAADEPSGAIAAPGVFAEADPKREAPAFAFASLGGKLSLPVSGSIESGFGRGDATRNRGLVVAGRPDALVRAPTDGWIVYAGPFRSYGEIVILNVGDDYRMVLSGLDSSSVALGQFVLAGEPIGRLGGRGSGSGVAPGEGEAPTLYIEVREGERPVDPARWFAPVRTADAGRAGG